MPTKPSEYLKTKVSIAGPEELQLLLYDGAVRFASQARTHMVDERYEEAYNLLLKSQRIVLQMAGGLNQDANPELCGRLSSLYMFIYRRLVDANMAREIEPIDDALKILKYERDTWAILISRTREARNEGNPSAKPDSDSRPAPAANSARFPPGFGGGSPDSAMLNVQG